MKEDKLSIIIPARNEMYLEKTIKNVLENAKESIEVFVVLDGYIPSPQIHINDKRVLFIHNSESIGQRQSINKAARISTGKYMMKLDAHCAVDKGFDKKLKENCEYDWTVIPRMYNLDIKTWKPKFIDDYKIAIKKRKVHDYMYIGWNDKNELRTLYYGTKENNKWHQRKELIDDTMSCMGCCFFMHLDRFWELGGCDENHGGWGQQGIEVALKAWLSGGALKVNKKTWFAHWFRASDGGFPYEISGNAIARARDYSMNLWLHNKLEKQVKTIEWLISKFNPPSWEGRLGIPEGKWYQEAIINGVSMPTERIKDTSQKRWDQFIFPLIKKKYNTVLDIGCNAGFYSRKLKEIGCVNVTGIEKNDIYYNHAVFWEKNDPKSIKLIHDDIKNYKIGKIDLVLIANVHYWFNFEDFTLLIKNLKMNACNVLIVGRHTFAGNLHKMKPDINTLKKIFNDWNIVDSIVGKKFYSILFKNMDI